jgi:hypothetical protein
MGSSICSGSVRNSKSSQGSNSKESFGKGEKVKNKKRFSIISEGRNFSKQKDGGRRRRSSFAIS